MPSSKRNFESFVNGSLYGVIFQILSRVLSLILNLCLVRLVDIEVIGLLNIKLNLLRETIVVLCKDPFRKGLLSSTSYEQVLKIIWLVPFIGCVVSIILGFFYSVFLKNSEYIYYNHSVILHVMIAFLDIFSEPFWYKFQIENKIKTKIFIDSVCATIKPILILIAIMNFSLDKQFSLLILSILGFVQAIISFGLHYYYCRINVFASIIQHINLDFRKSENWRIIKKFWFQTVFKQVLGEVEKYIMTFTSYVPLEKQGIYNITYNLCSLVLRILCAPVEEASFIYFSKMLPRLDSTELDKSLKQKSETNLVVEKSVHIVKNENQAIETDKNCMNALPKDCSNSSKEKNEICQLDDRPVLKSNNSVILKEDSVTSEQIEEQKDVFGRFDDVLDAFRNFQKLFSLLGILLVTFGCSFSYELMFFYFGSSRAVTKDYVGIMNALFLYVFTLFLNGLTEAFYFATISSQQIDKHNTRLLMFSVINVFLSISLVPYINIYGLIFAQILLTSIRIFISLAHFKSYCIRLQKYVNIKDFMLPKNLTLFVIFISFIYLFEWQDDNWVQKNSDFTTGDIYRHMLNGFICLFGVLATIIVTEKDFLVFIKSCFFGNFFRKR